jgi:hypothetical protein
MMKYLFSPAYLFFGLRAFSNKKRADFRISSSQGERAQAHRQTPIKNSE